MTAVAERQQHTGLVVRPPKVRAMLGRAAALLTNVANL
jgi:hypothetical protein